MGREQSDIRKIIYISTEQLVQLEQFFLEKGVETVFLAPEEKSALPEECLDADLLLYIVENENECCLAELDVPDCRIPAILACRSYGSLLVQNALEAGFIDILPFPDNPDQLESQYKRLMFRLLEKRKIQKLYNDLKESESRLHEKNTILETILDILTHDTRNIFMNLSALVSEMPDTPLRGMIKHNINDLHNEIHEAAGYLGHKKRILNIAELLRDLVVSSARIPLGFHKRIEFTHDSHFVLFSECSPLFKNAVVNIVENALKYSPEGQIVKVHAERSGQNIVISISDSGGGVPDKEKAQIFDRYYRRKVDAPKSGSGRGLWITRNILEKDGGTIEVGDNPSGGAVFRIIYPAFVLDDPGRGTELLMEWFGLNRNQVKKKMETMETLLSLQMISHLEDMPSAVFCNLLDHLRKQKNESEARKFRDRMNEFKRCNPDGKKILIVDDSLYVKYYLANYLVELGYCISEYASTGEEAVSLYRELRPDLITMDCTMPVMPGVEAVKRIFSMDSSIPVLFITGIGNHPIFLNDLKVFFPENRYAVLTKPFKKEELKKELGRLLS